MTRSILLVFGGPATPEKDEDVMRWYAPHMEQMVSLPGIVSARLYRPSVAQFPRTTAALPETLGMYEYETGDVASAVEATLAAYHETLETGTFTLSEQYQTVHYQSTSQWPKDAGPSITSKTILLVWGGPTSPEMEEVVMRWYEPHLEQLCSLPGIVVGRLYRPSATQSPSTTAKVPETLGLYEYDTDDVQGAVEATYQSHLEGVKSDIYVPGKSIPPPRNGDVPWDDTFTLDQRYQSAYYDLFDQWPRADSASGHES